MARIGYTIAGTTESDYFTSTIIMVRVSAMLLLLHKVRSKRIEKFSVPRRRNRLVAPVVLA